MTSAWQRRSAFAAAIPANPPPTITICGFVARLGTTAAVCSCGREISNVSLITFSQNLGHGPELNTARRSCGEAVRQRALSNDPQPGAQLHPAATDASGQLLSSAHGPGPAAVR